MRRQKCKTVRVLTFDVEEERLALDLVVVGGDAVPHFAAVVPSGGLLHLVEDEVGRVVDAGEHALGAGVVVVVALEHLALRKKRDGVQFPGFGISKCSCAR